MATINVLLVAFCITSCKKFVEVDSPATSINAGNVYTDDVTATAVLTGIYARISDQNANLTGGSITSISLFPALSADELTLYDLNNQTLLSFYRNDLDNTLSSDLFWGNIYSIIFIANSAIDGLNNSNSLTPAVKQQLLGEAKFIRAFSYFYLLNLYDDVPLALTTDYQANRLLHRSPKARVYEQIIADLKDAQTLLSEDYLNADARTASSERLRPTKWAATALLARVYLYTGDYPNAEAQANAVINNFSLYSLSSLNDAFLMNSTEAIWQLQPVRTGSQANTGDGALFVLPASGPTTFDYPAYLSNDIRNSFEAVDQRMNNWVNSVTVGASTFYYPFKYKIGRENTSTQEYIMMLRLGEQYLIRAEARAQQNKINEAQADLNAIRTRAGLPNTAANDKTSLLAAILHERRVELFTEWGHRWFDLKRTNNVDAVMNIIAPQKGGTWAPYKVLYPIPRNELALAPNLEQNSGY